MHAAAGRAEVRIMETLPIRNRRLLVIDERQANRDRVCGLLQGTLGAESPPVAPERGYQVDTAGSAEEALGRIRSALQADAPYAVVFLGMPSVGADIPVLERFWRLDSRLQVVVHAPPADFPLLAPWAAEERLLLLGLPLQGQEVRQMAGNLSAKWNVTAHLQLQMSRMEAAIQEITREVGQAKEALEKEIGERKELESQLVQTEKLASIGHLAAGVAHEINNPISYVSSNYTTLEEHVRRLLEVLEAYEEARPAIRDEALARRLEQLGERVELAFVKEDVAVLLRESREGIGRVRKIVQDLKNFSRVDAEDDWQWTDLHQGIESTLNIVASELKYRADVVREYGDLPEVKCLPSQINQVVMNLVMNAAQAMGPERGRIVIRTGHTVEHAWIEVEDSGQGISPEILPRIFDPFFTTKPVGKGTGLGLSLSYGIVQKHGGTIEVRSQPGVGSAFRIVLPLESPGNLGGAHGN
ncbi:TPA: ATP-binding protein [Pseudomonas aeruginosa]|uniref:ATP-binding protein n=1 Tax=Pseudomonas aeruginosa TaxID=287 RepID=UPI000FF7E4D5|nr:ATP-binding protein [Pseudomonas aeruginosa]EKX2037760.1 hybrid sensor histidine kinase/response regulator [Pseudomonas aeruginosa]MBG5586775.1 hybrid sensor histidine kinase/response regulator [Pseudomonas aeruginosa]MCB5957178.1 hybrid sensor histidine kinase/response regulator [Pseudomonas aeruginosa]MDI2508955.1 ATP-binding protein [Pseudomonas aeruginosa]MDY1433596.1 ATP-binding protein [Pseudomonas aeruginosa]